MASEAALAVEDVSYAYGDRTVVRNLTLRLERGEMVALAGPNGSGKTTLLRVLSGILRPRTGSVRAGSIDLATMPSRSRARSIAVVQQHVSRDLNFTVRDLVSMGRAPYLSPLGAPSREDRAAVERALLATDSHHLAPRRFPELSGGEQQRVVLAMALAQETDYLLLDEPTVHLDLHHQYELLERLADLRRVRRLGILAILHDLNLAALYFDRLAIMQHGALVLDGPPSAILQRPEILQVFGAPLQIVRHPATGAAQVLLNPSARGDYHSPDAALDSAP